MKLLIKNADVIVTMDENRREIKNGAIVVEEKTLLKVGPTEEIERDFNCESIDKIIDATGTVILPGFINCHHHLYQTLTRSIGTSAGLGIFDWLKKFYPIWSRLDSDAIHTSTLIGLAELMLSGTTTTSDHLLIYTNDIKVDDEIRASQEIGMRFHPTRGAMDFGEYQGGFPPEYVCESKERIIKDSLRIIETFHDPHPFSMCRVSLAPCDLIYTCTRELLVELVNLARSYENVGLHTHLSEVAPDVQACVDHHNCYPVEYASSLGWTGRDVWFAHAVHLNTKEIRILAKSNTGISHCPTSNMILASGIAPVRKLIDSGVNVALGVDGSASNDGNNMLAETRMAMLLQRVGWPGFNSSANRMSAREALELATLGGARVLGRDDIGSLESGKAADIIAFRVDDLYHAGALADPVASVITCAPTKTWLSIINGRVCIEDGQLLSVDLPTLIEKHNRISKRIINY